LHAELTQDLKDLESEIERQIGLYNNMEERKKQIKTTKEKAIQDRIKADE